MTALPGHHCDDHFLPDSERILRVHGAWQREWDEARNVVVKEPVIPEYDEQVQFAIKEYSRGCSPIQVRWALAERFGHACRIGRIQRSAEKAIQAAAETPADLRRAIVAIQRQQAIQGAIQDRAWGPAGSMLARAGEVAGELDREASLGPDDLRLVVAIEGEPEEAMLPPHADTESDQASELPDTDSDQGDGMADTDSDQAD